MRGGFDSLCPHQDSSTVFQIEIEICPRGRHSIAMTIEIEQESDGRWLAEIPALPGALAYGVSREEAAGRVKALALRVLADQLDHGEAVDETVAEWFTVAA